MRELRFIINFFTLIIIIFSFFFFFSRNFLILYIFFELVLFFILILIVGYGIQIEKINSSYYLIFYSIFCSIWCFSCSFSLSFSNVDHNLHCCTNTIISNHFLILVKKRIYQLNFSSETNKYSTGESLRKRLLEILDKVDVDVLLLDEWDANLDSENSEILSNLIDELSLKKCVIEVRHR